MAGVLDVTSPVNWDHPLNQSLYGWWMVPPNSGWRGGLTLRDLVRGGKNPHDGTLSSAATWQGTKGMPGVYGSVGCTGGEYVSVPFPALTSNDDYALIITHRPTTWPGGFTCLMGVNSDWELSFDTSGNFTFTSGGILSSTIGGAMTAGNWWQIVFTRIHPTGCWAYVNGKQISFNGTSGLNTAAAAGTVRLGDKFSNSAGSSYDGVYSDIRFYLNKGLTASAVTTYYEQFRRGHPDTIRWLPTRTWFIPQTAGIAFDAASNSGYQAASSSYSWSHTCTGSDRFLAVDVGLLSAGQTVTGITYNGVALSLIGAKSTVSSVGRIECWGLINPASGSNTIAATLSGSIASAGCAVSYTGVHQTTPTESFDSAQATNVGAADAAVSITTIADNDWVHAAIATNDTAITASQTSRNNVTGVGGSVANEDTGPNTPAGLQAVAYTSVDALQTWAIGAYGLRPLAATGTSYTKSLTGTQATSVLLTKLDIKGIIQSQGITTTLTKSDSKPLSITQATTITLTRLDGKPLSGSQGSSTTLAKLDTKSLTGTQDTFGLLSYLRAVVKLLTATQGTSTALVKSALKVITGTQSSSTTLAKSDSKALVGTQTTSATIAKSTAKPLTGTQGTSPTFAYLRIILRVLTGTQGTSATLAKSSSKGLVATQSTTGTFRKLISRVLTGIASMVATLTRLFISPDTQHGAKLIDRVTFTRTITDRVDFQHTITDRINVNE